MLCVVYVLPLSLLLSVYLHVQRGQYLVFTKALKSGEMPGSQRTAVNWTVGLVKCVESVRDGCGILLCSLFFFSLGFPELPSRETAPIFILRTSFSTLNFLILFSALQHTVVIPSLIYSLMEVSAEFEMLIPVQ